jgi:hypothetical protein
MKLFLPLNNSNPITNAEAILYYKKFFTDVSYAHIEGNKNIGVYKMNSDSERSSHIEGIYNFIGNGSGHAEGGYGFSFGALSHTEGIRTAALGAYSHVEGGGNVASRSYQHVFGKYNNYEKFTRHAETATKGTYV